MRQTIDPPADAVADAGRAGAHRLVADLIKNRQMWDADGEPSRLLPEDIRAYMKIASTLPAWRDEAMDHEAERSSCCTGWRRPRCWPAPACRSAT